MHLSVFVILINCICLSIAQQTTPHPIKAPIKPKIFEMFSVDAEKYDAISKTLTGMKIVVNVPQNLIRMTYNSYRSKKDVFYNYAYNDILVYDYAYGTKGKCKVVQNLATSPLSFIAGGVQKAKSKHSEFGGPTALGFFHFEGKDAAKKDITPTFEKKTTIRDKDVDMYTSKQTWMLETGDTFMADVTHYFLDSKWKYAGGDPASGYSQPVMMRVIGQLSENPIDVTYSYFNIMPYSPENGLETPPGIDCPQRLNQKTFPGLAPYIRLDYELIDTKTIRHNFYSVLFDTMSQVSVVRTSPTGNTYAGLESIVIINNFKTGLSYRINEVTESCDIKNVTQRVEQLYKVDANNKLMQIDPGMLFYVGTAKKSYIGQRKIRNIYADTWVGTEKINVIGQSTIEWFFAQNLTHSWNDGFHYQIPLKVKIWPKVNEFDQGGSKMSDEDMYKLMNPTIDMNIFHVDYTAILYDKISIAPCLPSRAWNHFSLYFPGAASTFRSVNLNLLKKDIIVQIGDQSGVSNILRIDGLQLHFYDDLDGVTVTFSILDKPPYASDVVKPPAQLSLKKATGLMKDLINSGKFQLDVKDPFTHYLIKSFTAHKKWYRVHIPKDDNAESAPKSLYKELEAMVRDSEAAPPIEDDRDTGYSFGSLATILTCVLVVGAAAGGSGSYYFIYKKKRGL